MFEALFSKAFEKSRVDLCRKRDYFIECGWSTYSSNFILNAFFKTRVECIDESLLIPLKNRSNALKFRSIEAYRLGLSKHSKLAFSSGFFIDVTKGDSKLSNKFFVVLEHGRILRIRVLKSSQVELELRSKPAESLVSKETRSKEDSIIIGWKLGSSICEIDGELGEESIESSSVTLKLLRELSFLKLMVIRLGSSSGGGGGLLRGSKLSFELFDSASKGIEGVFDGRLLNEVVDVRRCGSIEVEARVLPRGWVRLVRLKRHGSVD